MITRALIRALKKKIPNDPSGRTRLEKLAEAIVAAAGQAKIAAFIALADRVEGKATPPMEASSDGNTPVQIIFDVPRPERDEEQEERTAGGVSGKRRRNGKRKEHTGD